MVAVDTTEGEHADGTNQNHDAMLNQKIEMLLLCWKQNDRTAGMSRTLGSMEQLLVALVLLSRVQHDTEFMRLMTMMMESCGDTVHRIVATKSVRITTQLQQQRPSNDEHDDGDADDTAINATTSDTSPSLHCLMIRLITQLLHRFYQTMFPNFQQQQQHIQRQRETMHNSEILHKYDSILKDIIHIHMSMLKRLAPPEQFELVSVVSVYFQHVYQRCVFHTNPTSTDDESSMKTVSKLGDILHILWKFVWYHCDAPSYSRIVLNPIHRPVDLRSTTDNTAMNTTSMMKQTLHQLLNESSCCTNFDDNNYNMCHRIYRTMVQCLLQCTIIYYDVQLLQTIPKVRIPSFWTRAISEWLQQQTQSKSDPTFTNNDDHGASNKAGSSVVTHHENMSLQAYALLSVLHRYLSLRSMTSSSSSNQLRAEEEASLNLLCVGPEMPAQIVGKWHTTRLTAFTPHRQEQVVEVNVAGLQVQRFVNPAAGIEHHDDENPRAQVAKMLRFAVQ